MALRWLALAAVVLLSAPSMCWGQTIQLPTFSYTTVSTSVLVPDRGSTSLGGFGGSSSGSNSLGLPGGAGPLFRSRSIVRSSGASNISVHVTIIDHRLWDDAVMASVPRGRVSSADQRRADWLSANVACSEPLPAYVSASNSGSRIASLEDIRRRNEAITAQRVAEANDYFREGKRAEAEGKAGTARVYYQMASRRAEGPMLEEIKLRLAALR